MASILHPVSFDRRELSYGQILSIFSTIPALISFVGIVRRKWTTIKSFISDAPDFIAEGLYFIRTGQRQRLVRQPVIIHNPVDFQWSLKWIISKWYPPQETVFLIL
jgi:hypothetical protein